MEAFASYIWSPLFSVVIITAVYAIGERITAATKGLISGMMVAACLFIAAFVTGILPRADAATGFAGVPMNTGLGNVLNAFGTFVIVTHLGTVIKFKELINEWKTVVVCLGGFLGIMALCMGPGAMLFGRDEAYTAVAPITGGIVATQITAQFANAAGLPEMAAFAFLVSSFQGLIGMPIASFFLKRECDILIGRGEHLVSLKGEADGEAAKKKLFKPMNPQANTWIVKLCKLSFVAWLGVTFSWMLSTYLAFTLFSAAVSVLFFGILFHELGFLDDDILNKAGCFNLLMLGLYHMGPTNYSTLNFQQVTELLLPLVGLLVLGAIGIIICAFVVGKVLKVPTNLSIACGLAAMFGFPGTLILTTDAVRGTGLPDDQRQNLMDRLLPKMIVAGFTTVTIASVIFAGILAPMIY